MNLRRYSRRACGLARSESGHRPTSGRQPLLQIPPHHRHATEPKTCAGRADTTPLEGADGGDVIGPEPTRACRAYNRALPSAERDTNCAAAAKAASGVAAPPPLLRFRLSSSDERPVLVRHAGPAATDLSRKGGVPIATMHHPRTTQPGPLRHRRLRLTTDRPRAANPSKSILDRIGGTSLASGTSR